MAICQLHGKSHSMKPMVTFIESNLGTFIEKDNGRLSKRTAKPNFLMAFAVKKPRFNKLDSCLVSFAPIGEKSGLWPNSHYIFGQIPIPRKFTFLENALHFHRIHFPRKNSMNVRWAWVFNHRNFIVLSPFTEIHSSKKWMAAHIPRNGWLRTFLENVWRTMRAFLA